MWCFSSGLLLEMSGPLNPFLTASRLLASIVCMVEWSEPDNIIELYVHLDFGSGLPHDTQFCSSSLVSSCMYNNSPQ